MVRVVVVVLCYPQKHIAGGTSLLESAGAVQATKPVCQDWGKVVFGKCCRPNLSARIGVESLLGGAGAIWQRPNTCHPRLGQGLGSDDLASCFETTKTVSKNWGKAVIQTCLSHFEATKPVSQDWGNVVVGRCWHQFEANKPVSQDWGKVVVGRRWRKQPNLSARKKVTSLLASAGTNLYRPNLPARIGVRSLFGSNQDCQQGLPEGRYSVVLEPL